MFRLVLMLLAYCVGTTSGVATRTCGLAWAQRNHHCYQLFEKHLNFDDGPQHYVSGRFCNDIGANLAEISSEEENNFVKAWLKRKIYSNQTQGVWIGGKKTYNRSNWTWVASHEGLVYTDWADGQGPQSIGCLSMSPKFNYSWVPERCHKTKNMKYICEKYLCDLPSRCFNGSCYSLNCATYRAASSAKHRYDKDVEPNYLPCPGGRLAQIESQVESDFIQTYLDDADAVVNTVWIGGYEDVIGRWKWRESGKTISDFTHWATQPDSQDDGIYFGEVCIGLSRAEGWAWKKFECSSMRPVLCERPAGWFRG